MLSYTPPIDDMRFVLHELVGVDSLAKLPGFEEVSADIIQAVLEEGGRFCAEVLLPINRSGDERGCVFENGVVRTPEGFKEAFALFTDNGWLGLQCAPEHGGQGLPGVLSNMFGEMMCATNLSFSIYGGLTHGAYNAVNAHANDELKAIYLPNMVSGRWTGTMCLTESHCGTDLGLIKTKALPQADGTYQISGTKIFISAGEHDLSENIIHLVLARTPDAPSGTKGISLFLAPKLLVNDDGSLGERNALACGGIEAKMGIHASATCVMNFDGARAYLVGQPNKGMRAMFTMMNAARLAVALQGTGVASGAYQGAVAYCKERIQGRALAGAKSPEQPADSILVHADVRRTLLLMRAYTEGARALGAWIAKELDLAVNHPETEVRQTCEEFVALMTPIAKAFFTDIGVDCANMGMQLWGGHGYVRDNGMEQLVRDGRIAQIYEGTNAIQALDLVGRKVPADMGRKLRRFFHPVDAYLTAHANDAVLRELVVPLAKAFGRLQRATGWVAQEGLSNPDQAAGSACEYLRLFGLVAMGYVWVQMAQVAHAKLNDGANRVVDDDKFYRAKVDTAKFYMEKVLPQTSSLFASIMAGSKNVMQFDDEAF